MALHWAKNGSGQEHGWRTNALLLHLLFGQQRRHMRHIVHGPVQPEAPLQAAPTTMRRWRILRRVCALLPMMVGCCHRSCAAAPHPPLLACGCWIKLVGVIIAARLPVLLARAKLAKAHLAHVALFGGWPPAHLCTGVYQRTTNVSCYAYSRPVPSALRMAAGCASPLWHCRPCGRQRRVAPAAAPRLADNNELQGWLAVQPQALQLIKHGIFSALRARSDARNVPTQQRSGSSGTAAVKRRYQWLVQTEPARYGRIPRSAPVAQLARPEVVRLARLGVGKDLPPGPGAARRRQG